MKKKIITLNFPLSVLNTINEIINSGLYASRSHLVRQSLEEFLEKEEEFKAYLDAKPKTVTQKIITVNLDVKHLKLMKKMVGDDGKGLYFSRSELVRVAIRDFLIKERFFKEDPELAKLYQKPIKTVERNAAGEEIVTHDGKKWRILAPGLEYV